MRRDSISTFLFVTLPAISLARVISSAATTHTAVLANKTRIRTRTREKHDLGIKLVSSIGASSIHAGSAKFASTRGGGDSVASKPPSIYWAILHNWLYFFSLGFNAINIQFLAREVVDGDFKAKPSAKSISLSGKVESVDKLLTFLGVGFLSALSDKFGRKPLMAWSALGFMLTNLIQAKTKSSVWMLYLADFVDGCSSCMAPLCQAFIADVSEPQQLAGNLGILSGLSVGGAFIFAFPIGGLLGSKFGPRLPLLIAAGLQLLNALIIIFITPESSKSKVQELDLREANPISGLKRLFCNAPILRTATLAFFCVSLARCSLDAQFTNYANIRFGWSQAQAGPTLVLTGLMLAVAPRLFISYFGVQSAILTGMFFFALGLAGAGLAPTPGSFIFSIFIVSIGCICLPALQSVMANSAKPSQRGAVLGAIGSLTELAAAIGSTLYAGILAKSTAQDAIFGGRVPGMHFLCASLLLMVTWGFSMKSLVGQNHPAVSNGISDEDMDDELFALD